MGCLIFSNLKLVLSTRSLFVTPMLSGCLPGSPDCALKERLVELEWDETGVGRGGRTSGKKGKMKAKASHGEF